MLKFITNQIVNDAITKHIKHELLQGQVQHNIQPTGYII